MDNLQQRYQQISAHLQRHRPRFTVDFQYQPDGVRIEGAWHPVVKMQWVEGLTLNANNASNLIIVSSTAMMPRMLTTLAAVPGFENLATDGGFVPRPDERAPTRFERRGQRLGHAVWDLAFRRV